MTRKQKRLLMRIALSLSLFAVGLVLDHVTASELLPLPFLLAAYGLAGWDVLFTAVRNIGSGQIFDENFLMSLATIGAFALRQWDEGVAVMIFYQVGELFQSCAVERSRRSISELMDLRPDFAVALEDGQEVRKAPEEVAIGDLLLVRPGERVPVDGVIVSGSASVDTSKITGESMPVELGEGDTVLSGCVNLSGVLHIRAESAYAHSTVARILELTEEAQLKKAKTEQFITRFARVYTPAVVVAAVLLAIVPPLALHQAFLLWVSRALLFLVISCPCALVISVPLSFFGGIGGASKQGILVKGGSYLETLAGTDTVVFDKTGTLTQGCFRVTAVQPTGAWTEGQLLEYAALAEQYSDHPIALSLRNACRTPLTAERVSDVEEIAGHGVLAKVDGCAVGVGNSRLMERLGISWRPCDAPGTVIYVSVDGAYAGCLAVNDVAKEGAGAAIAALKRLGVRRTVMLTGDNWETARAVAEELKLDEVHAELLPADKVARVEALLAQTRGKLAFVGDGINDAPVLTRADVGIAMGALGSDAAIEAADVVLMDDRPEKLATAIGIARKTVKIVRENIVFALGVKGIVLVLGALGKAPMWLAVFADVGVAFLAILNAMRCLHVDDPRS